MPCEDTLLFCAKSFCLKQKPYFPSQLLFAKWTASSFSLYSLTPVSHISFPPNCIMQMGEGALAGNAGSYFFFSDNRTLLSPPVLPGLPFGCGLAPCVWCGTVSALNKTSAVQYLCKLSSSHTRLHHGPLPWICLNGGHANSYSPAITLIPFSPLMLQGNGSALWTHSSLPQRSEWLPNPGLGVPKALPFTS